MTLQFCDLCGASCPNGTHDVRLFVTGDWVGQPVSYCFGCAGTLKDEFERTLCNLRVGEFVVPDRLEPKDGAK